MKKVGIVGGAGYTAGELIRLLIGHKKVSIDFIFSTSNAGNLVSKVHQDLYGDTELSFSDKIDPNVDILFLCLGHGHSEKFLEENIFSKETKIIDLSNDFRLIENSHFQNRKFIYGLTELHKTEIEKAHCVANPGCFATAIQLALLPLAKAKMINSHIHINATTGSTGAGVSLSPTTHFSWRDNNFSSYKIFEHQHLGEISESLKSLQNDFSHEVLFIPNRGNFSRGIFASCYTLFQGSLEEAMGLYNNFYKDAIFTHISDAQVHLKQVINTNKCLLSLKKHKDFLLVTAVIDNLLKGASGQAIENMNLMLGYPQGEGLGLKPSGF